MKRKKTPEVYQLLVYSENCQVKLRKFDTKAALHKFIVKFRKKYPDKEREGDNWIDFAVYDVCGEVKIHDESNWMVE